MSMAAESGSSQQPSRRMRLLMVVLWPAFVMAGVLETLVFAMIDPADLTFLGGAHLAVSSTAIYTMAFLVFWAVIAGAAAMAVLLATLPPADIPRD